LSTGPQPDRISAGWERGRQRNPAVTVLLAGRCR